MSLSHSSYFEEIVGTVAALTPGTLAAVVSWEGLVLRSNVTDENSEAQLGALASVFLDQGKRMFTIPMGGEEKGKTDTVQTMVTVGLHHAIIMTQLLPGALLVAVSPDKSKINVFLKTSLSEVDRLHSLIQKKEIIF